MYLYIDARRAVDVFRRSRITTSKAKPLDSRQLSARSLIQKPAIFPVVSTQVIVTEKCVLED
jgi:hypothetical protein